MLKAMMSAEVGDDVFRKDPTINALEERMAAMFGHEAALFCASGTMANQLAIKCHTQPLDEMICDISSHVYQYETAGYGFHSGISVKLLHGTNGKITPEMIATAINPDFDWLPNTKLVVVENSCNRGGGSYYTNDEVAAIRQLCLDSGLKLHLDGARLFNVLVETGESTKDVGQHFDSISICLSKGLGAPVGSVLIGDAAYIKKARKFRKVFGGGMRQAGILAAAGLYALDHNIKRLKIDNDRAKYLGDLLTSLPYVEHVRPVQTNIIIFDLVDSISPERFVKYLEDNDISSAAFGPQSVRLVTHLDIRDEDMATVESVLKKFG